MLVVMKKFLQRVSVYWEGCIVKISTATAHSMNILCVTVESVVKIKDFKCTSKPYKSHFILTCRYHQLMYEIDCLEQIAAKSSSLIHPTLGQLRTNATESRFNTLTRFRSK